MDLAKSLHAHQGRSGADRATRHLNHGVAGVVALRLEKIGGIGELAEGQPANAVLASEHHGARATDAWHHQVTAGVEIVEIESGEMLKIQFVDEHARRTRSCRGSSRSRGGSRSLRVQQSARTKGDHDEKQAARMAGHKIWGMLRD